MKQFKYKVYRSSVDFIALFPYLFVFGAIAMVWLVPGLTQTSLAFKIAMTCFLGLAILVLLWCLFSTYYVITDTCVIIKFGPLKRRVGFESIKEVKQGTSLMISCSNSISRVFLCFGKGVFKRVEISPANEEEFVCELQEKIKQFKENT